VFCNSPDRGSFAGDVRTDDTSRGAIRRDGNRAAGIEVPIITRPVIEVSHAARTRSSGRTVGRIAPIVAALIERGISLLLQGLSHAIAPVQPHGGPQQDQLNATRSFHCFTTGLLRDPHREFGR